MASSDVTLDLMGTPPFIQSLLKSVPSPSPNEVVIRIGKLATKNNYWLPDISAAGFLRGQENNGLFEGRKPHYLEFVNGVRLAYAKIPRYSIRYFLQPQIRTSSSLT